MDDFNKEMLKIKIQATARQLGFKSTQQAIRGEIDYVMRCKVHEPERYAEILEITGGEEQLNETIRFLKDEFLDKEEQEFDYGDQ